VRRRRWAIASRCAGVLGWVSNMLGTYGSWCELMVKMVFMGTSCSAGHTGWMRLLLVEDDVSLATVVERGLREDGYAVDVAGTMLDALHELDTNDYDVAVLDLGLPDGDGVQICRWIRERGRNLPVLMLTARDGLSDKVDGLDAGADDYLTKPFDYPELTARLRALLRRPADVHQPVLEVESIHLDPATRIVRSEGVIVPLTAREFSLLEHLMRHGGLVVSREALLEHVWDTNYNGLSNVVDVHIANLRRKLTADDVIETIRGVGYRIGAEVDQ
jgi:two-component system OmpR family response regulator